MPDARGPRFRLDAVALLLLAVGAVFAFSLATYQPLTGVANLIGPASDRLAAILTDGLGFGAVVFVAGWFAWVGLYIARGSWLRLAVRGAGWLVLSVVAA